MFNSFVQRLSMSIIPEVKHSTIIDIERISLPMISCGRKHWLMWYCLQPAYVIMTTTEWYDVVNQIINKLVMFLRFIAYYDDYQCQ